MSVQEVIDRAEGIQARLLAHQPAKLREWSLRMELPERGALVCGPRGVGKTTWMLSQAAKHHVLYLSVDNPVLSEPPLFDIVEAAFMRGYEGVLLDEVHYAPDWARHVKAAYDAFPGRRFVIGDSSAVALRKEIADLSRRFPMATMPLLSFREYLALVLDREIPQVDPFSPNRRTVNGLIRDVNVLRYFRDYMQHGFRPFFMEDVSLYEQKVMNTLTKAMESDIPFIVPQITQNHLRLMHSVIGYLAVSTIPTVQVNSLCREWSVGKEKLYQLLSAMERAHLLRIVRKRNDTRMLSVGAKILLHEPAVYRFFGGNQGTSREAFAAGALLDAGHRVFASSNETDCDFVVEGRTIEIGGRRKKAKAADLVVRDDVDLPSRNVVPLWILGMAY